MHHSLMLFFPGSIYIFCNFSLDLKRYRQESGEKECLSFSIHHMPCQQLYNHYTETTTVLFYPLSSTFASFALQLPFSNLQMHEK